MRTSVIAGLLGPLLVLWGVAAGQHGQGTFESLPGHDRYQAVLEAQRPMRRSGRIRRVEWTEDGTALLFHRDDKAFRFNLESRELAEVTEAEPEALYAQGDGSFAFARTASRLHEMQSDDYLSAPHLT